MIERELTPEATQKLVDSGAASLVDVRRDDEWQEARIPGAGHLPLDRLAARAAELDRSRPVVFYCRVGERSLLAADACRASGIEAASMAGGIQLWRAEGRPTE
ncbi:MAG: rhodanese-like domain-containing protein [Nocardioidaceae bacterium]